MVGSVLHLVLFGVVTMTLVAAFFGVGFLFLVEELPASRITTHEAPTGPAQADRRAARSGPQ
jgi:hypothetical protein